MSDASSNPVRATLLIETAEQLDVHQFDADVTIGRDRRCTIVVEHPTVSRTHGRVFRNADGWHFQDLGSQNGSKLGDARTKATTRLREGSELRIGRVRAWFFADAVPQGWTPPEAPRQAGKLIRCACGHIGWAPVGVGEGQLRCAACGRDITRRDPDADSRTAMLRMRAAATVAAPARAPIDATIDPPTAAQLDDCAACHTPIAGTDAMQTCADCAATLHADCWNENRGCATYGCSQVGVLDRAAEGPAAPATLERTDIAAAAAQNAARPGPAPAYSMRPSLIAVIMFSIIGVATFGVPAIGFGIYQLIGADAAVLGRHRYIWAATSFVAGLIGIACSSRWWLGVS